MRKRAWIVATTSLLLLLLSFFLAACPPAAGGSCSSEGSGSCADDETMLVCEGGSWREVPCRGVNGCTSNSDQVLCDTSGNRAGDACTRRNEGTATCTTADNNLRLKCTNGTWVGETCYLGCSVVNDSVVCL